MLLSCAYPIYHTFTQTDPLIPIDYTISWDINEKIIYNGRIFSKNAEEETSIDVSPIFRQYLNTNYESVDWDTSSELTANGEGDNITFTINSVQNTKDIPFKYLPIGTIMDGRVLTFNTSISLEQISREFIRGNGWELQLTVGKIILYFLDKNIPDITIYDNTLEEPWLMDSLIFPTNNFIMETKSTTLNSLFWYTSSIYISENVGTPVYYNVIYDYNTDFKTTIPSIDTTINLISDLVSPNQYITIGQYTDLPISLIFSLNETGGSVIETLPNLNMVKSGLFGFDLNKYENLPKKITVKKNANDFLNLRVVDSCKYKYCIYYINKSGGLDWILCNATEGWTRTDIDVVLEQNQIYPKYHNHQKLKSEVIKKYNIQTPLIKNEKSHLIDHLFNSPKIWIMDLRKRGQVDELVAGYINPSSITIKKYPRDENMTYSFEIQENKSFLRK